MLFIKRMITWSLNLILIVLSITTPAVLVNGWVGGDNPRYVPGLGPYKLISVLSDSMSPVMQAGDAILVESQPNGLLSVGDIVTCWRQDSSYSLLTHRIIEIRQVDEKQEFYTRGDANEVMDGDPVPAEDIVGRFVLCIPRGGYFISFLHTKAGFLLLILFPFSAALVFEGRRICPQIRDLLSERKENNPKAESFTEA